MEHGGNCEVSTKIKVTAQVSHQQGPCFAARQSSDCICFGCPAGTRPRAEITTVLLFVPTSRRLQGHERSLGEGGRCLERELLSQRCAGRQVVSFGSTVTCFYLSSILSLTGQPRAVAEWISMMSAQNQGDSASESVAGPLLCC